MQGFDPAWFGERIEEERNTRGWKLQTLQSELAKQTDNARGTSYGAVWSYIKGKAPADPRREVIDGLAALFGVRPEYLMRPGEERTDADATAARRAEARVSTERQDRDPEAEVFRDGLNPKVTAEAMLWRLWAPLFWKSSGEESDEEQEAISVECAHRIVRAVLAPLEELDALSARDRDPVEWESYIIGVCAALYPVIQRQADEHEPETED